MDNAEAHEFAREKGTSKIVAAWRPRARDPLHEAALRPQDRRRREHPRRGPGDHRPEPQELLGRLLRRRGHEAADPLHGQERALRGPRRQAADPARRLPGPARLLRRGGDRDRAPDPPRRRPAGAVPGGHPGPRPARSSASRTRAPRGWRSRPARRSSPARSPAPRSCSPGRCPARDASASPSASRSCSRRPSRRRRRPRADRRQALARGRAPSPATALPPRRDRRRPGRDRARRRRRRHDAGASADPQADLSRIAPRDPRASREGSPAIASEKQRLARVAAASMLCGRGIPMCRSSRPAGVGLGRRGRRLLRRAVGALRSVDRQLGSSLSGRGLRVGLQATPSASAGCGDSAANSGARASP